MHKLAIPLTLPIALLLAVTSAHSQTATVKLTAEDSHVIREILLKELNYPTAAADDYKIGDQAPAAIALETFPAQLGDKISAVKSYRFFVSGRAIVVVDPKNNRIADVIE